MKSFDDLPGLRVGDLEMMVQRGCQNPGCDHVGHPLVLGPRCHRRGTRVVWNREHCLEVRCAVCDKGVVKVRINRGEDAIDIESRCCPRASVDVVYGPGWGSVEVNYCACRKLVARIFVARGMNDREPS